MRIFIWLLVGFGIYLLLRGGSRKRPKIADRKPASLTFQDPVCGLFVDEDDAVIGKLDGERIYFCSLKCLEEYRRKMDT